MSDLVVLYDDDCGFCAVMLALLLRWDRRRKLTPVAIQSAQGEELLSDLAPADRLGSWHLIDGEDVRHSAGGGIPVVLGALPGGIALARITSRFPGATSLAYEWVASHRAVLGRPLRPPARTWAAGVIAERGQA
ncbi:MAG TPA: DCC1-like thiol-disulfide oxidoreductase family protein [Solirubrobacteraceae bacterium]|nr:DCC1-like thiol-disulfide oxidoreductase family protein [Solirubrobacteraceae bacterium]